MYLIIYGVSYCYFLERWQMADVGRQIKAKI